MSGLSDYAAEAVLNWEAGVQPMPSLASRYLALFTTAPTSDAGTGGTEVSGGSYARVQVAGVVAAGGSFTTASTSITLGSTIPAWVAPGMNVYDTTNSQQIGTVGTGSSGTTLNLTTTAAHASSGATDNLQISAWPAASASSGSEPATTPASLTNSNAVITFAQATASWGTAVAWGLYDASISGNLITWDYLGNNKWIPFTCTSASPGVLTADTAADAPVNASSIVVTSKYGGTLPTTGGSWAGLLTTANLSGATFTAGVNTTGIGGGQFRQVTSQAIANNVTASFSTSTFTLSLA
jgi:hypothetical protein